MVINPPKGISTTTAKFYLDGNRTDGYTENGSVEYPFKTLANLFSYLSGYAAPFVVESIPTATAYAYTGDVSFPAQFMTIFGNGSTWAVTGNITLNAAFHIENLYTAATGTLTYAATAATESERIGGSLTITGGIFTSGYEHFFDMSILMNTLVTLNAGATPVFTNVVGTPRFVTASGSTATTVLTIINCQSLATGAYVNVNMSNGGIAVINGFIATNNGTVVNINLSGSSGASASVANLLRGVSAAQVTCGSAYTYASPDCLMALFSGTALHFTGPIELATYKATAQTATIASTAIYTALADGIYRMSLNVRVTTAGSAGTVVGSVNYQTTSTISLTSTGHYTLFDQDFISAGSSIPLSATVTSNTGGVYEIFCVVERVG